MRITRFIVVPLIGVLIILGACGSPAATPAPAAPTPTPTPAPTTPTPTPTTPAPTPTTPAPTPTTPVPTPTTPAPAPTKPANPTGPAVFVVSELKAAPERNEPEDTASVFVTVRNTGAQEGTYAVVLKANDQTFDTKSVTLRGGESQIVTFSVKFGKAMGRVELSVEQLKTFILVEVF